MTIITIDKDAIRQLEQAKLDSVSFTFDDDGEIVGCEGKGWSVSNTRERRLRERAVGNAAKMARFQYQHRRPKPQTGGVVVPFRRAMA